MKYFKDQAGKAWAFEPDGSQDHLITDAMIPMSEAEVLSHRNPAPDPAALAAAELRAQEAKITTIMLAEAIVSGDTEPLRAALQKVKDLKGKAK